MIERSPCRLLRHDPAVGAWNMAVDEMLLNQAQQQASTCLRLYRWSEPTLSLGYFQSYQDRDRHAASRHCAAVRRLTGGGAIIHDSELTYSIVLPGTHPLAACRDELYRAVHGCLIEVMASFGATAGLCEDAAKRTVPLEPFLCFQRRSLGDVLLGEHKICGSAQRRRNKAVLQHGSLLWRASRAAPELPGVADLVKQPISLDCLRESWLDGLRRRLEFDWIPHELDETEVSLAWALVESRYCGDDWTNYRGRGRDGLRSRP